MFLPERFFFQEICLLVFRHGTLPPPSQARNNVLEACQDLWDEFEHVFLKLATRADSDFARGLCASELGLCAKPIEREAFKAEL